MPSDARRDDVVVRVEGLGKRYLVPQHHGDSELTKEPTLRDQLKEFFPRLMGAKERDYFWALRGVSFEVRRGEVFGIVGQNGSGKSTLLKMMSRVTHPTEGSIRLQGRVGSLLEVGTGFHPDLTGRQNVYFNGALLGASQEEVASRVDDIIAFSGIGPFIDVPVKRYSSGMYVRLAYSVASLLESDILLLDEVLAVGDASFKTKTDTDILKKTSGGKTVLLVSHSPQAIVQMCDRGIILDRGKLVFSGTSKEVIGEYLSGHFMDLRDDGRPQPGAEEGAEHTKVKPTPFVDLGHRPRVDVALPKPTMAIRWLSVHDKHGEAKAEFQTGDTVRFRVGFTGLADTELAYFAILIHNTVMTRVATISSTHVGRIRPGVAGVVECEVPALMLGDGLYNVMVDNGVYNDQEHFFQSQDCISHATYIEVRLGDYLKGPGVGEFQGAVHRSVWRVISTDDPT